MLFEVFFRVVQVALCLGGQHIHFLAHPARKSCNEFITTILPLAFGNNVCKPRLQREYIFHVPMD
jgi:hypothetical protein